MYKAMQTNKEAIESESIKYKHRMKYSKGMHKIEDMVDNRK